MAPDQVSLALAWDLPAFARRRLALLPTHHVQKCFDIDFALNRLLGTRASVREWMWWPAPWLFHSRPVEVVLASQCGCERLRLRLLGELAESGDDDGVLAALASLSLTDPSVTN